MSGIYPIIRERILQFENEKKGKKVEDEITPLPDEEKYITFGGGKGSGGGGGVSGWKYRTKTNLTGGQGVTSKANVSKQSLR